MKMYKQRTWEHVKTGVEGKITLFDLPIFGYPWKETGKRVKVKDPLYGQEYVFPVYTVSTGGQDREFAAGEFSNGIWGFYLER